MERQYVTQQGCNPKAELPCLHYDCTSFTGCNGTTRIDLAQRVVRVVSARAQSEKLSWFYM